MKLCYLASLAVAMPQFIKAPQFTGASVAAVSIEEANAVDTIAGKDPKSAKTAELLLAADEGLFPNGMTALLPVVDTAFCQNLVGKVGIAGTVGAQFKKGGVACSSNVQGVLPSVENMVSTLIVNPQAGATFDASKDNVFTIKIKNIVSGFFSNANAHYYLSPQILQNNKVQGHQHVVIQQMDGNKLLNPKEFNFFKGINQAATDAKGEVLTADIPAGTLVVNGQYRFCSITGSDTHQPILSPTLNRGPQDDCVRVNVVNAQGGTTVQAKGVAASAAAALKKTKIVEDATGLKSPQASIDALQAIAALPAVKK